MTKFQWPGTPKVAKYLAIAFIIREIFSFWTGHPFDFELWVRVGYWVAHGADPYTPLPPAPGLSFANPFNLINQPSIVYFPVWPLICGGMYLLYTVIGFGDRFVYYFLLKQPVIIGDVLLSYALYRLVLRNNERNATWVLKVWTLSPLTILISGVWGMFDSLAMLFSIAAVMTAASMRRGLLSVLAGIIKSIPMIYLLPLTLGIKGWRKAIFTSIVFGVLLSVVPAYLLHWSFYYIVMALSTSASHSLTTSMSLWGVVYYVDFEFFNGGMPTYLNIILGSLWIPPTAFMIYYAWKKLGFRTDKSIVQSLLICTIVFLLFRTQVNEQYSIYLLSLLAVDVACWHPERRSTLYYFMAIVLVYLLMNNYFLIRFISPVYPDYTSLQANIDSSLGVPRFILQLGSGVGFSLLALKTLVNMLRDIQHSSRSIKQFQQTRQTTKSYEM
jgi:hypothetical protein